uniref:hypothetical protein n=1 Tax=Escherichia coli TaxID=562 RepID=UPI001F5ECE45|nr:hypothetical protein [Escherichia coli]
MKLKYLLLCATLSVAFTSSAVLASENGKKPIPGKSDVMVADICLKPEIQSETDYKKTKELVIVGGDKLIIPFADGAAHEPIQRPAFSA